MNKILTTYEYEFFSEGFFGYAEQGNFKYFSIWHFLPIILMIAGILFTYKYRDKLRNWKHEKQFRIILAFIMYICEMGYYWRIFYTGSGDPTVSNLLTKLPVQVCGWTCVFAIFMLLSESKTLFDIDVYVCLTLGVVPLFTPAVITTTGPLYFRYYQFFIEHCFPIYAVFYMMFVCDFKFDKKAFYKPIIFLGILSIIAIYLNSHIPNANYMYLGGNTDGSSIANIMPENMYIRLLIYSIILFTLLYIEILIFRLIEHKMAKKIEK